MCDSDGQQRVGVCVGLLTFFSPKARYVRVAITRNGSIVAVKNVIKVSENSPCNHIKDIQDMDMHPVLSLGNITQPCRPSVSVHLRATDIRRSPRKCKCLFWMTGSLLALDGEIIPAVGPNN